MFQSNTQQHQVHPGIRYYYTDGMIWYNILTDSNMGKHKTNSYHIACLHKKTNNITLPLLLQKQTQQLVLPIWLEQLHLYYHLCIVSGETDLLCELETLLAPLLS